MTCHDAHTNLSLYLYGELEFAEEEALEEHLRGCALCQQALVREKSWHTAASAEQRDVPLDLLAKCRRELGTAIGVLKPGRESFRQRLSRDLGSFFQITPTRWSYQLALASFLVFLGFAGGRFMNRAAGAGPDFRANDASFLGGARIRDIQPSGDGQVRIVLDHVDQHELVGNLRDQNVRRWLLLGMKDSADPVIRVDSVDMLAGEDGSDVRDALLERAQHDPNAAVRLKALRAVGRFIDDPVTRNAVRSVLEHDEEPAIRAAAIDVLAAGTGGSGLTPDVAQTLRSLAASEPDDYLRARCQQILHAHNAVFGVY